MTILILGNTGKIGSFIYDSLILTQHNIISLGRSKKRCDIFYDFDKDEGDLSKLESKNIDLVINAIGKLPKHKASKFKYSNANIDAIKILRKYLNKDVYFVQLSTISIYGEEVTHRAVNETDEIYPKNNYAKSKQQAEEFIINNYRNHWIFRMPPVYDDLNDKVLFKRVVLNRFFEIIFNGDNQEHSYCSLDRLLEVINEGCITTKLPYGLYNLADKKNLSIKKIKSQKKIKPFVKIHVSANMFLITRDLFRFLGIDSISEKINEIYYKSCVSNKYCTRRVEKHI